MRLVPALAGLLALAWLPVHAGPLDPFAGSWRAIETDGEVMDASDLEMRIAPTREGFEIAWTELGDHGKPRTYTFLRTDRPGVYAADKGGGWLFKLFGDNDERNPLKGQTLRWARIDGDALIVYRLDVHKDGGYILNRYAWETSGGELRFAFEQRTHDAPPVNAEGRLARSGGAE